MKRRRIMFLCALVLVAGGVFALWPRGPKEPVYQGKKLSEWIKETSPDYSASKREPALKVVAEIGTKAMPFLLSELNTPRSQWPDRINEWLFQYKLGGFHLTPHGLRIHTALAGLSLVGTNSALVIPALSAHLADPEFGGFTIHCLTNCGESAIPAFLKACESANTYESMNATRGLGYFAARKESVIPPLIRLASHRNGDVAVEAIRSLSRARSQMELVIPTLTNALSSTNPRLQANAAGALASLGAEAKPAVPTLLVMMQDTNRVRASWASNALFHIDPTALPR